MADNDPKNPFDDRWETASLQPEQAGVLGLLHKMCRSSRHQTRGERVVPRRQARGEKIVGQHDRLGTKQQHLEVEATRLPGRPEPNGIVLPHWVPWIWVPPVVVLLSRIEKQFVDFLPGLMSISWFLAWFLAAVVEAAAWWLGRSLAKFHESRVPFLQMRWGEKLALLVAAPGVVAIQLALLVLRFVRTGQLASTIALTIAALVLFGISVWIHDVSTDGPADAKRGNEKRQARNKKRLGQCRADYTKARGRYNAAHRRLIVEPAQAKVTKAIGLMSNTNSLVVERGRVPDTWPVIPGLREQIGWANGDYAKAHPFPELDARAPKIPRITWRGDDEPPELGMAS